MTCGRVPNRQTEALSILLASYRQTVTVPPSPEMDHSASKKVIDGHLAPRSHDVEADKRDVSELT